MENNIKNFDSYLREQNKEDINFLNIKKEVLNILKYEPKLVKAVLLKDDNFFVIMDEENEEMKNLFKRKFQNVFFILIEELFEGLYEGNQMYIDLVRDSKVVYDLSIIDSLKKLIKKGKIKGSKEAIYHSFLKAIQHKENYEKTGKAMIAQMFWAMYYLLQSYFMLKNKYLNPKEVLDALKLFINSGNLDKKTYLVYEALYYIYYNLNNYKFEELEIIIKEFEESFEQIKIIVEKESKIHLNHQNK